MKKLIFAAVLIPIFAFQCKKDGTKTGWLEGKVIRTSCATIVVQVLDNDKVGEDGWKDISDNKIYDNVFSVNNTCKVGSLKKDDIIRFKLASPKDNDCVICMMYDAPPAVEYDIENLEPEK